MEGKIIFERGSKSVKNPMHIQKNVLLLYSPRKISIELATNEKIYTEIFASLPRNSRRYVISIFRTDEIDELFYRKLFYFFTTFMARNIKQIL